MNCFRLRPRPRRNACFSFFFSRFTFGYFIFNRLAFGSLILGRFAFSMLIFSGFTFNVFAFGGLPFGVFILTDLALNMFAFRSFAFRSFAFSCFSLGVFSFRRNEWKLIVDTLGSGGWPPPSDVPTEAGSPGQLYNLADDPGEENNLFGKNPQKVKELAELLESYRTEGRSSPRKKASSLHNC